MANLKDFYTRDGIVAKFILKDINGKDSGNWLTVVGSESSEWRKARQDRMRVRLSEALNDDAPPVEIEQDRETAELLSQLVLGWSYDTAFNRQEVEEFLYNTPYILDEFDSFISKRTEFFKKK